jgi:hypothetical protein
MDLKYTLNILLIFFIICLLINVINLISVNLDTFEAFEMNGSDAFCKIHNGFNLEKACNKLTKYNCGQASCCAWTTKCKAINKNGIIFTD